MSCRVFLNATSTVSGANTYTHLLAVLIFQFRSLSGIKLLHRMVALFFFSLAVKLVFLGNIVY